MPFVNNKPGTSQLPPLPANNQPKQAPAQVTAPVNNQPVKHQAVVKQQPDKQQPNQAVGQVQLRPQDQSLVSPQGAAMAAVALVESTPLPPALVKKGEASDASLELNQLLIGLGNKVKYSNVFGDDTEAAVREFQRDNGLRESGEVDERTLRKLIDSTKVDDENFPKLMTLLSNSEAESDVPDVDDVNGPGNYEFDPNMQYSNEFERVKDMVASQIAGKGKDPEAAFAIGDRLTEATQKWDRKMPSSSMCYTAVKRGIDDALNIPYKVFKGRGYVNGGSAKTAGQYLLSKSPEFVKIDGLKRADLDNLPAGAIIVYKPGKGAGHIGVQDGKGHDISDKSREQRNVHVNAKFDVWYPVAVRGQS